MVMAFLAGDARAGPERVLRPGLRRQSTATSTVTGTPWVIMS
jgi:hypothetical protein